MKYNQWTELFLSPHYMVDDTTLRLCVSMCMQVRVYVEIGEHRYQIVFIVCALLFILSCRFFGAGMAYLFMVLKHLINMIVFKVLCVH